MIEKSGSLYHIFKKYLKPDIFGWTKMTNEEALVEDAPDIARDAFDKYVAERKEKLDKGIIV